MIEILVLAVALYALVPRLAGLEAVRRAVANAPWWAMPIALALETASLSSYAELDVVALRGVGAQVARPAVYLVNISGTALGKALPGGTTASLPFTVRMLQATGVEPALAVAALGGSGLLASVVLSVFLIAAAVLGVIFGRGDAFAAGVLALATVVVAVGVAARPALDDPDRIATGVERLFRFVARGPLRRRLRPHEIGAAVGKGVGGFRDLAANRGSMVRATGWAGASWAFDFAAFATIALSVGRRVPLGGLPLAYVIGQMAAAVPLTPGGVGVVETTMAAALVAQGVPATTAAVTVLGWRLVSHWLPLALGLACFAFRSRRFRQVELSDRGSG